MKSNYLGLTISLFCALAASHVDAQVHGWQFSKSKKTCSSEKSFGSNALISFDKDVGDEKGSLYIWNTRWPSIVSRKTYPLAIQLDGGKPHQMFGRGIVVDRSQKGIWFYDLPDAFFEDASHYTTMQILKAGKVIGRYSLVGSAKAIATVLACAKRAGAASNDPFAN